MPIQASDGTWWSDDMRYYRVGDQWIPHKRNLNASQSSEAGGDNMSFQDENGTWWSNDKRYYRVGNQWILNSGTPSTSQPSRADQQTAQTEGTRYTLGTSNSFDVVDTFSQFPQYSAEPYQQPQQLTFGSNRQTPGEKPSPVIDLDPEFRASASSSRMLQAFVQARDKMAAGKVS